MYAFLKNLASAILKATGWGPVTTEPRPHEGASVPVMTFNPRF